MQERNSQILLQHNMIIFLIRPNKMNYFYTILNTNAKLYLKTGHTYKM